MPQFRFSRTLPTGWRVRLDYLTWDESYGGTVTEVAEPALVELGEHTAEFDNDGLPYGLCAPQKLKLTINYNALPQSMRDYLAYGYDTTLPPSPYPNRNTWWLWTDRGTAGASWYLEFIGCEEQSEGVDLEPGPGDTYNYSVELVDAAYHSMKYATGEHCFSLIDPITLNLVRGYIKLFNTLTVDQRGRNVYQRCFSQPMMIAVNDLMDAFQRGLSRFYTQKYVRAGGLWPFGSVVTGLTDVFTSALVLKKSGVATLPRTAGADLTSSTLSMCWSHTVRDEIGGGVSSSIDKYGWARADSTPWDVLHDLAETLGVKISYRFEYIAFTGAANVVFSARRVGSTLTHGDASTTTYDARIGAQRMTTRPKIIKRGSGITKAEIQFESEFDQDARSVVRLASAARGSRSMNIEPIVHNIPTYQDGSSESEGRFGGFLQTNNLFWERQEASGTYVLAHENTLYRFLPGPSGAYVQATTTAMQTPIQHKDDDENVGDYRLQLNAVQTQATMQAALAKFAVHVFGYEQNGIIETSWNLLHTTEAMPHRLGAVHDLSYAQDGGAGGASFLASTFPEMTWARCVLTKSTVNYVTGEVQATYYVLSQSGSMN